MRNSLCTDRTKLKRKPLEKYSYMVTAAIKKPLIAKRQVKPKGKPEEKKKEDDKYFDPSDK